MNELKEMGRQNKPHRRHRSVEENRRIVEETFVGGASVSVVARRHDVNANQVFAWRQQYQQGKLSGQAKVPNGLVAVGVIGPSSIQHEPARAAHAPTQKQSPEWPANMIDITLGNGARVRIGGDV
jgi:transposase